jgi:iron complex outermembrane receptor protein
MSPVRCPGRARLRPERGRSSSFARFLRRRLGTGFAALLAASVVVASGAFAAEEKAGAPEAGDPPAAPPVAAAVTVTAHPVVEEVRHDPLAGSVTVVGRQQVDDLDAGDPAAALRRVPGVVVSRYNVVGSYGGGDGGAVFARGQGTGRPGSEVALSVDGVAKFNGVFSHPLLDNVSVDLAERFDVYKGAQPVLFGNMAFATVDVVSRRREAEGFGGRASAAYGSFETSALAAETSGKSGAFDFLVSASQRQSDGHREGSDGRTRALFARAGLELGGGWAIGLTGDFTSGAASDPGAVGAPRPPVTPRFETNDAMGVLTLTRAHGGKTGFVKLYVDDGAIDWLQWDSGKGQAFRSLTDWTNLGLKARDAYAVLGRGELTVGLDVDSYGGSSLEERPAGDVPLGDFRFRNVAPYAAFAYTFGETVKVTPSAGVRYNDSREFGGVWGAQAGVTVASPAGVAHARYARAFNLPGVWAAVFYQGYGRGDQWKSLQPELMDHWEVGLAPRLGPKASLDVTFFLDDVKDALRFVPPPPPPPQWANTGAYRARGAELSLSVQPHPALGLWAGAAWTATDPDPIPFTPRLTFSGGAVATYSILRLALDAQWVDERYAGNDRFPGAPAYVDAYFLLNGKLSARLDRLFAGLEAWVAGENLTGSDYAYRPGYPMPGASVRVGASVGF